MLESALDIRPNWHNGGMEPFGPVGSVIAAMLAQIDWDQNTLNHEPQVLWSRTSLPPAGVDVAELYYGFTFNCPSWIEGLGFCGRTPTDVESEAG